jgi:TRAP-type C4-dicarboxylate transport system substrate-binding protein
MKMKLAKWIGIALFVCLAAGLSYSSPAPAQTKPIELTYSMHFVASHQMAVFGRKWADEVEKRSNGRVKITMFPGGSLIPSPQAYDGVIKGIADIAMSFQGFTRGRFPLTEAIDLPLAWKSGTSATNIVNELYAKFQPKEYNDTQVMYLHAHGAGLFHTRTKVVNKLEDMKGLKIRTSGTLAPIAAALGAAPVAMPMGDTYDAIARGVVDGTVAPYEGLEQWKLGEVCKNTIENYSIAYSAAGFVVMNKAKWASLPPDVQKIIQEMNKEWIPVTGKVWDDVDKSGREYTIKRGNKIIVLSKEEEARWAKAVQPLMGEYVTQAQKKGVAGDEALKFIQERMHRLK